MKRFVTFSFILISLFLSSNVFAQSVRTRSDRPTFTYDLGASVGTYNEASYTEIQLGLNWYIFEYLNWRNAAFSRFGSEIKSASGLDSSARLTYSSGPSDSGLGFGVFAGPGYRISNSENSGVFGEAGLTLRAGGLAIGAAVKTIQYNSPGKDTSGRDLARTDTVVSIILAGGGAL